LGGGAMPQDGAANRQKPQQTAAHRGSEELAPTFI
jgi:hypothetical protein